MMFHCIIASLTKEGLAKITVWKNQYTINGHKSAICLLKIVIRESYLDTNLTSRHIREELMSLDKYMVECGYDIGKFNLHVKTQLEALMARGKNTNDLLAYLFKGYKAAKDKKFIAYIELKQIEYDDGADYSADKLMTLANNKYKDLVRDKIWLAPTEEEQHIMALQAKLQQLQKSKPNSKANDKKPKEKKEKDGKEKGKKPDWFLKEPPKDKMNVPKEYKKNKYYWCPKHKKYVMHKPEDCKLKLDENKEGKEKPEEKGNNASIPMGNKKLQLMKATQALLDEEE
jgi:hypothetical protein